MTDKNDIMTSGVPLCRRCGSDEVKRSRLWYGYLLGPLFIVIGFVLFLATLGFSFVLSLYGVFWLLPRYKCKHCGYEGRFFEIGKER